MSKRFSIAAERREGAGKGASRRLRRAGKVPGILYGAGQEPVAVTLDQNELLRHVEHEAFFSSILDIDLAGEKIQAIVKDVQVHPARRALVHLDLQRVLATEKVRMLVPLHFLNQATAKGVKEEGGVVQHLMTEVEISCLPRDLPSALALDIGELEINKSLHLSDIPLPEGVEIPALAIGPEQNRAVVAIHAVRGDAETVTEGPAADAAAAAPADAGKDKK